jgi:rhamnopyranosyl-N-acetylglucosaminyl-diphospho-decaprenol beta-1,3/1,4-galactofuranosyltransferase
LELLKQQTISPGKIFITENASTDGTAEVLTSMMQGSAIPFELIEEPVNLGNAGGVQLAMDRAFAEGFGWVWILDDDSWPEREALESLLTHGPVGGVRTSNVLALDSDALSWPFEIPRGKGGWEMIEGEWETGEAEWVRLRRAWLGALISREAYDRAGPVNGDLFLRGEDEDYPRRLEKLGFEFWMATHSVLRHPIAGALRMFSIFGARVCLERGLEGDRLYYRLRNMLWIKNQENGLFGALMLATGYLLLLTQEHAKFFSALRILREALKDALAGNLGKRSNLIS